VAIHLVGAVTGVRRGGGRPDLSPQLTYREFCTVIRINDALSGEEITRIVSGPSDRCLQTVARLARDRALRVEVQPELGEIASVYRALGCLLAMREQPALACMPAALFHAVVDLLLLADVRVDQVGDLVWMKRIEDSPVGIEAMVGRARIERKQNGKGGPAVNIQEPMRCMRKHHALRSAP
jgi:hypothetical protein